MVAVDLPVPRIGGEPWSAAGQALGAAGFVAGREISLRVFDAGLACCAVEVSAALRRFAELSQRSEETGTPGARQSGPAVAPGRAGEDGCAAAPGSAGAATPVHVLVVAGTVTDKLAPLVREAHRVLPEPRLVLSFGACSNSGGPYWDSYCVTKGVDQLVPVDVYVPGCPPRPEALLHALRLLLESGGAR
jgi:NADH-quinone oxidoreductase subunit B